MVLENGVENIQDMAYNGARTVYVFFCESPMAEGIERWSCIPRVSGLIPCTGNLTNC